MLQFATVPTLPNQSSSIQVVIAGDRVTSDRLLSSQGTEEGYNLPQH